MYQNRMLILYFYFLLFFLKIQVVGKILDIKALGNNQNEQII